MSEASLKGLVDSGQVKVAIIIERGTEAALARGETVPLGQRAQTFTFPVDKEPLDVVLDPNTWLLAQFGRFGKG